MALLISKLLRAFNYQSFSKDTKVKVVTVDPSNSLCATKEIELKDRISELPDDIIFSLVSDLPLKEVGRLSILSQRWRYPWRYSKRLDFENDLVNAEKIWLDEFDKINFVKWVNQVLESHDTSTLEHVRFSYGLDKHYKSDLDKWLKFVFSKQVESIDLDLRLRDIRNHASNSYTLTHDIFSSSSTSARGLVDEQFIGFKSLKSLRLNFVMLSAELFDFLLDNCSALEQLSINYSSLTTFKVTGKNRALKFLELRGSLERIEISDVNLVSLTCHGCYTEPKLVFKNVPSLVNLHLSGSMANFYLNSGMNDVMAQLSGSLKSLTLRLPFDLCFPDYKLLPELNALEKLVVQNPEHNHFMFSYYRLITKCPNLQKIEFQAAWRKEIKLGCKDIHRYRLDPPHQCLKDVKLCGYYGCDLDVMSAFYFFDNAMALEKVTIDPHNQKRIFDDCPHKDRETRREQAARKRAQKQLKGKAPRRVQLVIL